MTIKTKSIMAAALGLTLLTAEITFAQTYIYPNRGQTAAQENQDKTQCQAWAKQQAAENPTPVSSNSNGQGTILRTSARGAAGGAIGGAIFGNPGTGAAAGAALGAFEGILRRHDEKEQAQAQQAQAQQRDQNQAFAACMQGRGYSVTFGQ